MNNTPLTVKKLKEILNQYPDDIELVVYDEVFDGYYFARGVHHRTIGHMVNGYYREIHELDNKDELENQVPVLEIW